MTRATTNIWTLTDLATPWAVHVAATLGVADRIAEGVTNLPALASACGADRDALGRLLRHLVDHGVFRETAPGRFALNAPARSLVGPAARFLDLDGLGGRTALAWSTLLSAVRTGRSAYSEVFGRPFWDDLSAHPAIRRDFDALMGPAGHGPPDPDVLIRGDWADVRSVVDVGGGTGSLLAAILRAHPGVSGVLVDRPTTVRRAAATFSGAAVADRVRRVGQSFFDPLPAGADLYVLKSVLVDWPDAEARRLLARCAAAARPRGRVVVVSGVHPDRERAPPELLMLVLVGGKARSLREFRVLARRAGLRVTGAGRTRSGRYVVECRPATGARPRKRA